MIILGQAGTARFEFYALSRVFGFRLSPPRLFPPQTEVTVMGRYKTSVLKSFHVNLSEEERKQADASGKSLHELVMLGLEKATTDKSTHDVYVTITAAKIKERLERINYFLRKHDKPTIMDLSVTEKASIRKQVITAYNNEVQEEKKGEEHEHDSELL
jgi:hypothetical protein